MLDFSRTRLFLMIHVDYDPLCGKYRAACDSTTMKLEDHPVRSLYGFEKFPHVEHSLVVRFELLVVSFPRFKEAWIANYRLILGFRDPHSADGRRRIIMFLALDVVSRHRAKETL